jgi:tRNA1(Val) A37 N6-methylase TrmN6
MLKEYLKRLHDKAADLNHENILQQASSLKTCDRFIDLGCDDGVWTMSVAKAAKAISVHGLEIVEKRAKLAKNLIDKTHSHLITVLFRKTLRNTH